MARSSRTTLRLGPSHSRSATRWRCRTGGTALDAEEPCTVEFDGDVEQLPFAHTAWWTFTGTGGDVTIDTAGSDFDTIIGVYVPDGGSFEQVGCVDDVFDPETEEGSLQSRSRSRRSPGRRTTSRPAGSATRPGRSGSGWSKATAVGLRSGSLPPVLWSRRQRGHRPRIGRLRRRRLRGETRR